MQSPSVGWVVKGLPRVYDGLHLAFSPGQICSGEPAGGCLYWNYRLVQGEQVAECDAYTLEQEQGPVLVGLLRGC